MYVIIFNKHNLYILKLLNFTLSDNGGENIKASKIAGLVFMVLISFSMVSGSFAAEQSHQQNINVKNGDTFTITLRENPTTGYIWSESYDQNFLELKSSNYIPNMPILCGSGGIRIFEFKALKTGETSLIMAKSRPWDNCLPVDLIFYNVNITE